MVIKANEGSMGDELLFKSSKTLVASVLCVCMCACQAITTKKGALIKAQVNVKVKWRAGG